MKKIFVFLGILSVFSSLLFSQEKSVFLENDTEFITIILHGLDRMTQKEDNPSLYEPENYEPLGERSREYGINNIFHYNFANMSKYDSNDFIKEIGDFNNGSQIIRELNDGNEQPFLSLARNEWIYRHSPALRKVLGYDQYGKDPWWFDDLDNNRKMETLLTMGPRFVDFLLVQTVVDESGKKVPQDSAFEIIMNKLRNTITGNTQDLLAVAKEFYQLASGNYYDEDAKYKNTEGRMVTFGEYMGYAKCPSTFRFITHSMGGMMISRFISEPESEFSYTKDLNGTITGSAEHGFYQRNLDYTRAKFQEDLAYMKTFGKLDSAMLE
jgi:hypothetical protein